MPVPCIDPECRRCRPSVDHEHGGSVPIPEGVADVPLTPEQVADDIADARKAIDEVPSLAANPKAEQALRDGKVPLDLIEPSASRQIALVMATGAKKYGRRNYIHPDTPIRATTYVASLRRHIDAWLDGEDDAPDTGLSHWAHVGANANVVLAAMAHGTFIDDRAPEEPKPASAVSNAAHSARG